MKTNTLPTHSCEVARFGRGCLDQSPTPLHLLTNGQLVTLLTASGTGYTNFANQAITRWKSDISADSLGYFFYLRDLESNEFWSLGYQPTCQEPTEYDFSLTPGTASVTRSQQDISARLDVCIHEEWDVELRRCTLTNNGTTTRSIELTSYAELVLQDPVGDQAHPGFSKIFVETSRTDSGILLAHRRPRRNGEQTLSACHFVVHDGEAVGMSEFETDRNRFIGRGRSLRSPAALDSSRPLNGTLGSVLDPVFSLRTVLILPPMASVTVIFGLGAGYDQTQVIRTAEQLNTLSECDRAFERADAATQERLLQEGLNAADLKPLLAKATQQLYGLACSKHAAHETNGNGAAQNGHLHAAVDDEAATNFLALYHIKPLPSYVHGIAPTTAKRVPAAEKSRNKQTAQQTQNESLEFANGFGGFAEQGREYVIRLEPNAQGDLQLPPVPWNNVICSESLGFIASETGAGNTWASNSRLNRLTPWQNDPVLDPHSEAIYLRDRDSGEFWSLAPGPVPQNVSYEVRHGWGYTIYRHESQGLSQELTQFVPRVEPVKINRIVITNNGDQPRRLSLYGYVQWELGEGLNFTQFATKTTLSPNQQAVFATNSARGEFSSAVAFAALAGAPGQCHLTADRTEFLGQQGSTVAPRAVASGEQLQGHSGSDLDQCAALQTDFVIEPGQTVRLSVLLGETDSAEQAGDIITKYQAPQTVNDALAEVQNYWRELNGALQIETPSREIDLMINGWLPYQNISCRFWGRTSPQQSGGAYGFRDQLQDVSSLIFHRPDFTRQQILRNASHQFVEGDVLHWWHPPLSKGIRTIFADDLLWMPLVACEYVNSTGDEAIWNEQARFLTAEQVPAGEAEIYLTPEDSGQSGSLYEHCCRALDRGLTRGRNGLPLMGCGDWNDGMNRVGQGGTGESVWMGFFIDYILERMLPVCAQHGDQERVERYSAYREQLRIALEEAGWDGNWYRRAYFDDGTPLGTASGDECQIDALVQAWAAMSGAVAPERIAKALASADERLVDREAGIIRLLHPAFNKMPQDPGYIKGYLPGVRENGGQYTHGVLWLIRAMAEWGMGTRACELLEMLSPVSHGNSPEAVDIYKAEPYVVAADVYGSAPHAGRAGWSWYTGSAGWMFRVAVESLLGLHLEQGTHLRIDPSISSDWPECKIRYRVDDKRTTYEITIRNPNGQQRGVKSASCDGQQIVVDHKGAHIPMVHDGLTHQVIVEL